MEIEDILDNIQAEHQQRYHDIFKQIHDIQQFVETFQYWKIRGCKSQRQVLQSYEEILEAFKIEFKNGVSAKSVHRFLTTVDKIPKFDGAVHFENRTNKRA